MKCPKCNRTMVKEEGGYYRANVRSGFGRALPANYSCINCGKYIEIFEENETHQKISPTNYPKVRKNLGEPGWLRQLVEDHIEKIIEHRNNRLSWNNIYRSLKKDYNEFNHTDANSLGNVYRRVIQEKQYARV